MNGVNRENGFMTPTNHHLMRERRLLLEKCLELCFPDYGKKTETNTYNTCLLWTNQRSFWMWVVWIGKQYYDFHTASLHERIETLIGIMFAKLLVFHLCSHIHVFCEHIRSAFQCDQCEGEMVLWLLQSITLWVFKGPFSNIICNVTRSLFGITTLYLIFKQSWSW